MGKRCSVRLQTPLGPLMEEQKLAENFLGDLPDGFREISCGNVRLAVKELYAEAFSGFTLPPVSRPAAGGHRSGRGRMVSLQLDASGSNRVLIRRYIRGGVLGLFCKQLYLNLGRPRPLREALISEYARQHGISTPEVLAAAVETASPFLYRAAIATREIRPGATLEEEAHAYLREDRAAIANKRRCIEALGQLVAQMHDAGIYHADLHLKNVLKSGDALYVLDLDGASIRKPLSGFRRRMNILRLCRSAEKINRRKPVITRTDMTRFVEAYAAESGIPPEKILRELRKMMPLWRLKWRLSDLIRV